MTGAPDRSLLAFEDALAVVVAHAKRLSAESIPTDEADGRWLAQDVCAPWPIPAHDHAALDGFAVGAAACAHASLQHPVELRITGQAWAADTPAVLSQPDHVIEIATGARIPSGADAVIRYEATERRGAFVVLRTPIEAGTNIRRRGEDIASGERVLEAGHPLDAAGLGILAAFGQQHVEVVQRPRVAVLATGNELRAASRAQPDQVTDVNSPVIVALARRMGASIRIVGIASDDDDDLVRHLEAAMLGSDLVVTIGGASVGGRDRVYPSLARLGAQHLFTGVAIKPGKPCGLSRRGHTLVLSVPGNAAAAALTFELFGAVALASLQGATNSPMARTHAATITDLTTSSRLTRLVRGRVHSYDSRLFFAPTQYRGSATLRAALGCNGIAVIAPASAPVAAGSMVPVLLTAPPAAADAVPFIQHGHIAASS